MLFLLENIFKSIWVAYSSLIALSMLSERAQVWGISIAEKKGISFLIILISLLKRVALTSKEDNESSSRHSCLYTSCLTAGRGVAHR